MPVAGTAARWRGHYNGAFHTITITTITIVMITIIMKTVTEIITILIRMTTIMTCRQRKQPPGYGRRPAAFASIQTALDAAGLKHPACPPPVWGPLAPTTLQTIR